MAHREQARTGTERDCDSEALAKDRANINLRAQRVAEENEPLRLSRV